MNTTEITDAMVQAAILRHTVTALSAAEWTIIRRGALVVASFPSTRSTRSMRGEFVVVAARGGGVTLAERTGDSRIHSCQCSRCPRALPVVLAA
jgi:hypothetical protein